MPSSRPPAASNHDRERLRLEVVQRRIAALAEGPVSTIEVPVDRVSGRVLAEPIPCAGAGTTDGGDAWLGRGTVLSAVHVATLAGLGRSTVRVFERTRVGIVAWHDHGEPGTRSRHASVASATLSAAVEQMGAKAFASTCRSADEACLVRSVKMFAAECSLVLVIGFPGEEQLAALKRAGLSCDASGVRTIALHPFGEIRLGKVGSAHIVALPKAPADAFAAFAALVSPLLRALSGRSDLLPILPAAILAGEEGSEALDDGLAWVRERAPMQCNGTELVRCAVAPACFAGATGLAWRAPRHDPGSPTGLIYLPFKTWLG